MSELNSKIENPNERQELTKAILLVLKGKRASLCKSVLKDLLRHEIDKKSTVN
ncbi:hypothetical protein [Flavobacterium muglaense]|uniref:Uncharacterized protein n=1 Tax=Flavobacterium muglaense TaxID=2764716 RepID=A0A923N2Q4_9FLAO|nr:hypothetical protein [Flavobacterium muglaense]MBC5839621.1 hypothetical protein [Flavobacterium muglaense]MBC5846157.1 hypothetical protein [Flavobacterium muglaense]